MNLSKFFNAWIFGEGYPKYAYGFSIDSVNNGFNLNIAIDQTQTSTLFWMPIQIKAKTKSGDFTFTVWDSLASQNFKLFIEDYPLEISFDPNNWIMKETTDKIINPSLDQGILLVNGIDWQKGDQLFSSYEDKAFWGNTEITFWDIFTEPTIGYPSTLPTPLGNGQLSNFSISNYSTIIWLSEFLNGDISVWKNLALMDYLNGGGNIILITKRGKDFIDSKMQDYLGITWDINDYTISKDMKSVNSSFTDINLLNDNIAVSLFNKNLTKAYSTLLYVSEESFDEPKGSGVWAKPAGKGQFIYIAGRPYYFDHSDLKLNIQKLLVNGLGEVADVQENELPTEIYLWQNYPNPFNPITTIKYSIPLDVKSQTSNVKLAIYDILGREVATLVNQTQKSGNYSIDFDASNLTSGIYYYQLSTGNFIITKKMTFIK